MSHILQVLEKNEDNGFVDAPIPKLVGKAPEGLRGKCLAFNSNWAAKGGKIRSYTCPCCLKENQTPIPSKKEVSSKGYWDSLTICYECGNMAFLFKYPNGQIIVKEL